MDKRFDLKKLTLTDFNPSDFQKATSKLSLPKKEGEEQAPASPADPVPEGRTTLHLNKVRGVVSPQSAVEPSPSVPSSVQSDTVPPSVTQPVPVDQGAVPPVSALSSASSSQGEEFPSVAEKEEIPFVKESGESILAEVQSPEIRNVRAAALHVKAAKAKYKKQSEVDPEESVAFNTRQPKWLKDKFFMACEEKGMTPSIVIRNLMKSYCGLCLVLLFTSFSFSADSEKSSTYSTEQLLSYFYTKAFSGFNSFPSGLKASLGARHSLWQSGAQDSTDYIYADHANTRLEAKLEIPILDISYLKDRSKDKVELRAFVMKSLSKILSAQKSVNVLESRFSSLRSRLEYLRNQVTLKLVNKSDIFPIEDQYYTCQSQLYESQSTLEQRIIDLAVIAGNDWLEAYNMIVKWDAKLF